MKKVILAIFLALVFCGQLKAQEIENIPSIYDSAEGKFDYKFIVSVEASWHDPIYSGEWDGWEMKPLLVDENGDYYFNIKAFNGPINFYWGDRKPKHNPFMTESTLGFNPQNGCMRYFLKDGKVYAQEQEQKLPGEHGDHLIRWSNDNNGTVTYFMNVADIGVDVTRPFVLHSASSDHEWWKNKIPIILTDASGWGSVKIEKKKNTYHENGKNSMYIIIAYGAYKIDGTEAYAMHFYSSSLLNDDRTAFKVPLP